MKPIEIAVATGGRFHALDLARELDALGNSVSFYSAVPPWRTRRFGLPRRAHAATAMTAAGLMLLKRHLGPRAAEKLDAASHASLDRFLSRRLRPCNVLVAMSGLYLDALKVAKTRYSATVYLERGSRHILSQAEILALDPRHGGQTVPARIIDRELAGYDAADVVTVPSRQAAESFLERGFPKERLFVNPYGVDVTTFRPTASPGAQPPILLFVGEWSYQKGCDVLANAVGGLRGRVRLRHVGHIGDLPVPRESWFTHQDPIPQWELPAEYAGADLFVLASRQEGLALVLAQAMACGLPIVCTDRTGGDDLARECGVEQEVIVVPDGDTAALRAGIERGIAFARARYRKGEERGTDARSERLSWRQYGKRYDQEIRRRLEMLNVLPEQPDLQESFCR